MKFHLFLIHVITTLISLTNSDGVNRLDRCKCPAGWRVVTPCDVENVNSYASCQQCPPDHFRGKPSTASACIVCPKCTSIQDQEPVHPCYPDQDNEDICQCRKGMHMHVKGDSYCSITDNYPCPKDYKLLNPDDRQNPPNCTKCEPGTHTDGPSLNTTCIPDGGVDRNTSLPVSKGPAESTTAGDTSQGKVTTEETSVITVPTTVIPDCKQECPFPTVPVVTTASLAVIIIILALLLCGSSNLRSKMVNGFNPRRPKQPSNGRVIYLNSNGVPPETNGHTLTIDAGDGVTGPPSPDVQPLLGSYTVDIITTFIPATHGTVYTATPKDTYAAVRPKLEAIKRCAPTVYRDKSIQPICIAIVDSGANLEHPACRAIKDRVTQVENVTEEGRPNDVTDGHGHGTQILSVYAEMFRDCQQTVEFVVIKAVSNSGNFLIGNFQAAVNRLLHRDFARVKIVSVSAGFHLTPREEWKVVDLLNLLKKKKVPTATLR